MGTANPQRIHDTYNDFTLFYWSQIRINTNVTVLSCISAYSTNPSLESFLFQGDVGAVKQFAVLPIQTQVTKILFCVHSFEYSRHRM